MCCARSRSFFLQLCTSAGANTTAENVPISLSRSQFSTVFATLVALWKNFLKCLYRTSWFLTVHLLWHVQCFCRRFLQTLHRICYSNIVLPTLFLLSKNMYSHSSLAMSENTVLCGHIFISPHPMWDVIGASTSR